MESLTGLEQCWLTCMPHVLYPDIRAGSEEQPLLGDEQEADDVWRECDTHKEHRKRLWDKRRDNWFNQCRTCHSKTSRLVSQLHNAENSNTHQSLVSKGIINTPDEEPERPQILEPELQHEISQQNQRPNDQELQVQKGTARSREIHSRIKKKKKHIKVHVLGKPFL